MQNVNQPVDQITEEFSFDVVARNKINLIRVWLMNYLPATRLTRQKETKNKKNIIFLNVTSLTDDKRSKVVKNVVSCIRIIKTPSQ